MMICSIENTCYYLVYIDEINDYNKIPDKTGKYHVYAMVYNTNTKVLGIEDYIFEYKQ